MGFLTVGHYESFGVCETYVVCTLGKKCMITALRIKCNYRLTRTVWELKWQLYIRVLCLIRQSKVSISLERISLREHCCGSSVQLRVTSSLGRSSLNLGPIKIIEIEFCVCRSAKSKRPVLSERIKQLPHLSTNSWSLRSYEVFKFRVNTNALTTGASDFVNFKI
jgi:hypothetical protein